MYWTTEWFTFFFHVSIWPKIEWILRYESVSDCLRIKLECELNILTCDANSMSWAKLWEYLKWRCDIGDEGIIVKIILFDKICYAD